MSGAGSGGRDPLGGLGGGALPPEEPGHGQPIGQAPPPRPTPDAPRESLAVKLRRVRKVAPMTTSLIAVLALAFALQGWAGGWTTDDRSALFRLGALSWISVENGDWWRLGSYAFLHIGFGHFLLNTWALWILMRPLEGVYGAQGALGLWTSGALIGGVASTLWFRHGGAPLVVAAGASGGIMALFGARIGLVLRLRKRLAPPAMRAELAGLVLTLLLNVALAFQAATGGLPLDNAAHLGGLASGLFFSVLMPIPALGVKLRERLVGLLLLGSAFGLAAMEGAAAARAVRPHSRIFEGPGFSADLPWQVVPVPGYDGWASSLVSRLQLEVVREAEPLPALADLPKNAESVRLGEREWLHWQVASGEPGQDKLVVQLLSRDGDGRVRVLVNCWEEGCAPKAEATASQVARTLRLRPPR